MKAVIVEIRDKFAAALGEDGRVIKIKNKNYSIGQEIGLSNRSKYMKIAASAAAALILFVTPAWAYFTPYSYVSLDINPSFEFSINRFDLVLDVKALNNDGEKVVESMEVGTLKNKEIKEAVKSVLSELKDQGYIIDGKEGGVVVAASSKSSEKINELAASLKTAVEEEVSVKTEEKEITVEEKQKDIDKAEKGDLSEGPDEKKETEVKQQELEEPTAKSEELNESKENEAEKESLYSEDKDKLKGPRNEKEKNDKKQKNSNNYEKFEVEIIEVSLDEVDNAKIMGITPGKWSLIEKLQESSKSDFDEKEIEKWLEKSVSDIMKEIDKNNKEYNKEERKEYKEKKSNVKETDKELDDEKRDGKNSNKRK
ncbi:MULTISPECIES: anti-sigma-I factor RsgI family protein [unclassified Sedimentibacter]|uniref:anti-sigma-I factor RsgI family protein n=1 Tax=unclassified Sedimentibacter TaxID=2649220 RepID=UPI0027DEC81C|nr:hypothetical protein [Sedimentibacter sp. MB35-C1]WMJ78556.1 hypothetical protein RBQ61_06440 [Sedimentibacter sp. MB35-C1]